LFQKNLGHLRSGIEQENGILLTQQFKIANQHRLKLISKT